MENLNLQIEEQNDDSSEEDEIIQLVKMKSLNDEIKQRETDDMDALPDMDVAKVTDGIASDEFVINADSDNEIDDETTKGYDEKTEEEVVIKIENEETHDSDDEIIEEMQTQGGND